MPQPLARGADAAPSLAELRRQRPIEETGAVVRRSASDYQHADRNHRRADAADEY